MNIFEYNIFWECNLFENDLNLATGYYFFVQINLYLEYQTVGKSEI